MKMDENGEIISSRQQIIKPAVYRRLHFRTKEILDIDVAMLEKGMSFGKTSKNSFSMVWSRSKVLYLGSSDLVELQRNLKYYRMINFLKGTDFLL